MGGGLDIALNRALALHVANLDYTRSWLGTLNGTNFDRGLRFSAGLIQGEWLPTCFQKRCRDMADDTGHIGAPGELKTSCKDGSKIESERDDYGRISPARIEYVRRDVHFLVREADQQTALHIEGSLVGSRPLRYEARAKPVHR
jgi:hypothetical protein